MKQNMKKLYIGCIILALVLLLGGAAWLILRKNQPTQGEQVAKSNLGVEWYDENGTEFTISTVEEFYEFAQLAYKYDFAGQTIKLGADLVLNEGNAEDWAEVEPENTWESIYGFAGTFDGQGHTISGVYGIGYLYQSAKRGNGTDYVTAGLFRNTQESCVIKNFKLVNSYFISDLNYGVGCISSNGGGTFDSIYTDAMIFSQKRYVGGIIGRVTENTTVTNCWFDGSIDIVGNYGRYDGGIAGRVEEGIDLTIEHCLVSGVMTSDLYQKGVNMGGMVGTTHRDVTVTIHDSLVSGKVIPNWTSVVGSVIGNLVAKTTVKATNTYVTSDTYKKVVGYHAEGGILEGSPIALRREIISGYGGYQWTTLDFDNYWAVVEGDTPVLKTFAENPLSLEGVERKVDVSWYNAEQDTFILEDAADLYGFALMSYQTDFAGKTVKLGANITLNDGKASSWAKNAPENNWISIGTSSIKFAGTFDGTGKTISGIYLKTEDAYQGMFGVTAETAVIKNFKLKNSYFESSNNSFGSIAGRGVGTFDSIYSDAIVVGAMSNISGIIGQVTNGKVTVNNCWFDGKVTNTAKSENRRTGGIIGCVFTQASVTNCLNTGTIDVSAFKAGEVSSSTGKVTKNVYPYAGGIIGYIKVTDKNYTSTISNCFNAGDVLVYQDPADVKVVSRYGSILGYANKSHTTIADCYATTESCKKTANGNSGYLTGKVIAYPETQLLGYGGYQWTTLDFAKYWSVVLGPDGTPILKKFAGNSPSVASITRMLDISWYNEKESTYVLYDVADLNGFALLSGTSDFAGKTVKLGADITINAGNAADWAKNAPAYEWLGIGSSSLPFAGTFDGQMHTISGVYLKTDEQYSGLFSVTSEKAVVKNFSLKNSYFESSHNSFGSIAGRGQGTFDTIYSDAIVVGSMANIGGMIGQVPSTSGVTMTNCWFDGTVTNTATAENRRTAGIVGCVYADSTFTNCLNTGTVDVSAFTEREKTSAGKVTSNVYPYAGGLVGYVRYAKNVKISGCLNTGDILVYENSKLNVLRYGSVLGYSNGSKITIKDTYATQECCGKTANASSPTKYLSGQVITYAEEQLNGYGGYQWTTLDFDPTKGYWAVVTSPDGTPILRSFAPTVPSLAGYAKMFDISWYDANSNEPYEISKKEELYGFAVLSNTTSFAGKKIVLTEDITFNNEAWTPIGGSIPFAGTFDGKDPETNEIHKISGMNAVSGSTNGLFAQTASGSKICNLRVEDSHFEVSADSKTPVGSIVGILGGDLKNVYSNATVTSTVGKAGGLVGVVETTTSKITECWYDGALTVQNPGETTNNQAIGGLVGGVYVGTAVIENCINSADITCTFAAYKKQNNKAIGGLVGYVVDSDATLSMTDVVMRGTLLVQYGTESPYTALQGGVDNSETGRGVCQYVGHGSSTVNDAYCVASEYGYIFAKKIVSDGSNNYQNALAEAQMCSARAYRSTEALGYYNVDTNPTGVWIITENGPGLKNFGVAVNVEELSITEWYYGVENYDQGGNTFTIRTVEELYTLGEIAQTYSFENDTIVLAADTEYKMNDGLATNWANGQNLEGLKNWTTVGSTSVPFKGTFDGNGSTITGLYMTTDSANAGLFGCVAGGTIQNFRLENSFFGSTIDMAEANANIGSVIGSGSGTLQEVYSDAIVHSTAARNGGFVGSAGIKDGAGLNIVSCWFKGTVKATQHYKDNMATGGFVGYVYDVTIDTCLNEGTVTMNREAVEGYRSTSNCTIGVGGLIGALNSAGTADIVNSVNTAVVNLNWKNTGACTKVPKTFQQYGTLIGTKKTQSATNSYNAGKVIVQVDYDTATMNGERYGDVAIAANGKGTALTGVTNTSGDVSALYGELATNLWFVGETRTDNGTAYWAPTGEATLPVPATLKKED